MPTSATVQCVNPSCPHRGEPRAVTLAEVGHELVARPQIFCSCGCQVLTIDEWGRRAPRVQIEQRPAAPAENETKTKPRNTSKRPPERRR